MRSRDRHQRGRRPPLASPATLVGQKLRIARPTLPSIVFVEAVRDAIDEIEDTCPEALTQIDIGVEEVPDEHVLDEALASWGTPVPLAVGHDATRRTPAHVVLYRRPIELRAADNADVAQLVYATLVDQLARVTGIDIDDIDPHGHRGDDDD